MHHTLSCVHLTGAIICSRICHLHCIEVLRVHERETILQQLQYVCMYVYNEGPYGQLGPDKCHLKQNTFNW